MARVRSFVLLLVVVWPFDLWVLLGRPAGFFNAWARVVRPVARWAYGVK